MVDKIDPKDLKDDINIETGLSPAEVEKVEKELRAWLAEDGLSEAELYDLDQKMMATASPEFEVPPDVDDPPIIEFRLSIVGGILCSNAIEAAAADAFTSKPRRIELENQYSAPAILDETGSIVCASGIDHFQALLDSSEEGGPYPITRVEKKIIRRNKISLKGKHYIGLGDAKGEKPALITQLYGSAEHYSFIDIVQDYLDIITETMKNEGLSVETISTYKADAFSEKFFSEVLDHIIASRKGLPVSFHCYGNTLNNEALYDFLQKLRVHLRQGDEVYLGLNSTRVGLEESYEDLDPWLKNGMAFTIERQLNLTGFNPDNFKWSPYTTTEGECTTVHFRMISKVRQELFQRLPKNINEEPIIAAIVSGLQKNKIVIEEGELIDCGISQTYTRDAYIELFRQAGFAVLAPDAIMPNTPLAAPNSFFNGQNWSEPSEKITTDHNIWRLIAV